MTAHDEEAVQLTPLAAEEFERYAPFAWALTQDLTRCGYPLYVDGVKGEADFYALARRSLQDANAGILLARCGGQVTGWLQYYYLAQDRYLSLDACCIQQGTPQVLAAFLAFAGRQFPGAQLMLGFPSENTAATGFLRQQGFALPETLYNHMLLPETPPKEQTLPACLQRVTRQNFADFRQLHTPGEADMYWTSDKLLQHLEDWIILLYRGENGAPRGAVWLTDAGPMWEIFGIDHAGGMFDADVCRVLLQGAIVACRQAGAKAINFLCEAAECQAVQQAGFHCVSGYECWQTRLPG